MAPASNNQVIVFDNLRRPSAELVGDFTAISAKALPPKIEPFVSSNAAGSFNCVESLDEIRACAARSGANLAAALKSSQ